MHLRVQPTWIRVGVGVCGRAGVCRGDGGDDTGRKSQNTAVRRGVWGFCSFWLVLATSTIGTDY